ncbi:MAG: type II secretion system protein, partial [Candidatus Hodarchaeales archaeon]
MKILAVVHRNNVFKMESGRTTMISYKNVKGFTLIELILYIALISIFMTGAVYFAWDVIYGREKAYQMQIVEQSANIALSRISYEIRNATDIQFPVTGTQLVLSNNGTTTTIGLNSERLQITTGGLGPYFLTSNQVRVTNSNVFEDLSSASNDSKDIGVTLVVEQGQSVVPGQQEASVTLQSSVELNSQFNQSRHFLMDLSNAAFNATSITGITIENIGIDDVVIDKLDISWLGSAGGENITNVQIGSGIEEWSGSALSGTVLELNDFTLASSDGVVDVDNLTFDLDLAGATINLNFIMGDGSNVSAVIKPYTLPMDTCNDYCIDTIYSVGICRKNAKTCGDNSET